LVVALVKWRDRDRKKETAKALAKTDDGASSTTTSLVNALLVTQLQQMNQQSLPLPSSSIIALMLASNLANNAFLSLIQTKGDP
jgi:hypothetical protein